jgi:hypothetical protein
MSERGTNTSDPRTITTPPKHMHKACSKCGHMEEKGLNYFDLIGLVVGALGLLGADAATLAAGQAAATPPLTVGSENGKPLTAVIIVGENVNATTIAAALAAING